MSCIWIKAAGRVECRLGEAVLFSDTQDHWDNAVRRLLNFEEAEAERWVEVVLGQAPRPFDECSAEEKIAALKKGTHVFYGLSTASDASTTAPAGPVEVFGLKADHRWVRGIGRDQDVEVVGPSSIEHGILMDRATGAMVRPPIYEDQYFEGQEHGLGYGNYLAQTDWRMEKAHRYVQHLSAIAQLVGRPCGAGTRLLDVGSGYGFFRAAAAEQGWVHHGVDVSSFAARTGEQVFGFSTFVGTLGEFASQTHATFDVMTLFDTIEHVEDPEAFMNTVASLLAPGGLCLLRTPNLLALEMDIFGPFQHSLKREHLHYFSAKSLCYVSERVGLVPQFTTTESHLLAGFLGTHLASVRQLLRGSDLVFAASKP